MKIRARSKRLASPARPIGTRNWRLRNCASLTIMFIEARIPLICTYDSDADAAYIYFDHPLPAGAAVQVMPFEPEHGMFNLDLNADGHVLGLEIIGARKHLPPALLQAILAHENQTENTN